MCGYISLRNVIFTISVLTGCWLVRGGRGASFAMGYYTHTSISV
jgi:hypothetical protein